MYIDVWYNKERYYCFKNCRVDMYKISKKKSSLNINILLNDLISIIIYRKRRYEYVYDYN